MRARTLLLFVLATASLITQSVRAQSAEVWQPASQVPRLRVLVMREDDAPRSDFALRVERALNRSLSQLGFAVSGSLLPFRDAQLAAGCSGSVRECGNQVAAALESEQLLVTAIEENANARYPSLSLQRFEAHSPVRAGTGQLPRAPAQELELTIYALVESVFSDRLESRALSARDKAPANSALASSSASHAALPVDVEPIATPATGNAEAEQENGRPRRTALLAVGWPSLALGAGLLIGGVVANLNSQHEGRAYSDLSPSSRADVDSKLEHARNAEQKAETAHVLWGVGGALAATGIFLLLWERFGPAADRKLQKSPSTLSARELSAARIAVAPQPHGVSLSWSAEL